MAFEPAEPAPRMRVLLSFQESMPLTRPAPDRRLTIVCPRKHSTPEGSFDGSVWLSGALSDSNAPPVGRPIAIGDGIRPAEVASLRS